MQDAEPDFSAILHALDAQGVRFVLIGGLAMIAYGSAHITVDLDISYARDRENLDRLANALRTHQPTLRGAPPDLSFVFDSRTLRDVASLTLSTKIGDVDLLAEPAGIDSFEALWNRSIIMELFGIPVHVASLDDLISMKQAAARPKDHDHLRELYAIRRAVEDQT